MTQLTSSPAFTWKHSVVSSKYDIDGALQLLRSKAVGLNESASLLLKMGEKGAMFVTPKMEKVEQSAMELKEDQIVDTTGAGDCFTGSFAVEFIRQQKQKKIWGKEEKEIDSKVMMGCIGNALKFGCCAGGLAVQAKGAMASFPRLDGVIAQVNALQAKL